MSELMDEAQWLECKGYSTKEISDILCITEAQVIRLLRRD